ncbi:hypothetical protein A33M_2219 [Rhodovulum sp. PH10]|uniref:thioesterase family protein n=1 Tax=Rhodovulum sp. PH10 TaxID=1187851 RepID=UPI00027C2500|nr:hotdog domain-containing protein [Rhodovulum sp. PH10]EJW12309.1 hypothetical protein A33M_2219 [Rhodovulum sp. PH10]
MSETARLVIGAKGHAALTVTEAESAPRIGSGTIAVLATPVMIRLMEAAALDAVEDSLPEGHHSLGVKLDVAHTAATPVGMRVEAEAELTAIDGRTLTFRVEARDAVETIGAGTHVRVVVEGARFLQRLARKTQAR